MSFTPENILLLGSSLLLLSIIASKASTRTGIPILLLFLLIGIFAGSDGIGINFSDPKHAQFIGNIALAIILFSGGMDTHMKEIRKVILPGVVLSTLGVALTALLTGGFIFLIMNGKNISGWQNISFTEALLLAAIMSSTDSASVFGILRGRNIHIKSKVKSVLELESGSNDPMAYLLMIFMIQIIQTSDSNFSIIPLIGSFLLQMSIGFALGLLFGKLTILIMNNINLSNHSLYSILLLSCGLLSYTLTATFHGNGFLAIYVSGIVIGNNKFVHHTSVSNFMDGLAWLFQIIMFLSLGLLVNGLELLNIAWEGLMIGLFLIFIARPLVVFLCLSYTHQFSLKSKLFISWVGLRGAVPIVFATYPLTAHIPEASIFFNVVFFITLLSLLLQGTTIPWVSRILGQNVIPEETKSEFGVELPKDSKSALGEIELTNDILEHGNQIMSLPIPESTLVVMIKRKNSYIIPKGNTILKSGDKLLIIAENEKELRHTYRQLGGSTNSLPTSTESE